MHLRCELVVVLAAVSLFASVFASSSVGTKSNSVIESDQLGRSSTQDLRENGADRVLTAGNIAKQDTKVEERIFFDGRISRYIKKLWNAIMKLFSFKKSTKPAEVSEPKVTLNLRENLSGSEWVKGNGVTPKYIGHFKFWLATDASSPLSKMKYPEEMLNVLLRDTNELEVTQLPEYVKACFLTGQRRKFDDHFGVEAILKLKAMKQDDLIQHIIELNDSNVAAKQAVAEGLREGLMEMWWKQGISSSAVENMLRGNSVNELNKFFTEACEEYARAFAVLHPVEL